MSAKTKNRPSRQRIATPPRPEPMHDAIALCARSIWEEEECPQGRDLIHWLLAEARLRQALQVEADAASGSQPRRTTRNGAERSQPEGMAL